MYSSSLHRKNDILNDFYFARHGGGWWVAYGWRFRKGIPTGTALNQNPLHRTEAEHIRVCVSHFIFLAFLYKTLMLTSPTGLFQRAYRSSVWVPLYQISLCWLAGWVQIYTKQITGLYPCRNISKWDATYTTRAFLWFDSLPLLLILR